MPHKVLIYVLFLDVDVFILSSMIETFTSLLNVDETDLLVYVHIT